MRGRKSMVGTDREKKQVQVRLPISEVEAVEANDYFGFKDLSKYILSLWRADLAKRNIRGDE